MTTVHGSGAAPSGAVAGPDLLALRATLESIADPIPAADGIAISETGRDSVRCLELVGGDADRGTILYVHGGAFCLLRADPYARMAGHLASITRARVVLPDYRLAPEHRYPIPLLDVLAVYVSVVCDLARASADRPFVLAGDSAGANLGLAALRLARRLGVRLPDLVVLFSPWLDLTLRAPSVARNAAVDTELDATTLAAYARAYAGDMALDHPLVSPRGIDALPFPALLIQAGADEILVDDARDLAATASDMGCEVTLDVAAGMQHNYQFWGPLVPQATNTFGVVGDRIERLRGVG